MNREDIIRMAEEVGFTYYDADWHATRLERFAALVAQAEREECAKVCEQWVERYSNTVTTNNGKWHGRMDADECAAAIRARGEKK